MMKSIWEYEFLDSMQDRIVREQGTYMDQWCVCGDRESDHSKVTHRCRICNDSHIFRVDANLTRLKGAGK